MTALEVNLQTPQCLEILRFAITLFCERSAKDYSLMAFNKKALSASSSWSIWSNYRFSFLQLCTSVMPFWCCGYDETNKLRLVISNFFCGGADNKRSRTIILCISHSLEVDRNFIVTSREWCIGVTMVAQCQWRYTSWANGFGRHLNVEKVGTWSVGRASG